MAERNGNTGLAFIVGGLVVAVVFLAWVAVGDGTSMIVGNSGDATTVTISTEAGGIAEPDEAQSDG